MSTPEPDDDTPGPANPTVQYTMRQGDILFSMLMYYLVMQIWGTVLFYYFGRLTGAETKEKSYGWLYYGLGIVLTGIIFYFGIETILSFNGFFKAQKFKVSGTETDYFLTRIPAGHFIPR